MYPPHLHDTMQLLIFDFVAQVEWFLYAIIMSGKFGWSATAAGAGQMAGDLGGALVLLVLSRAGVAGNSGSGDGSKPAEGLGTYGAVDGEQGDVPSKTPRRSLVRGIARYFLFLPFNGAVLLLLFGALFVLMASPHMIIAAVGQVSARVIHAGSLLCKTIVRSGQVRELGGPFE